MSWIALVGKIAISAWDFFKWKKEKKNTPEMVASEEAKDDQRVIKDVTDLQKQAQFHADLESKAIKAGDHKKAFAHKQQREFYEKELSKYYAE